MDIKDKTIFDLCDDEEILSFITQMEHPDKAEYLKGLDKEKRLIDIHMLSFITQDDVIGKAVSQELPIMIEWNERVGNFQWKYHNRSKLMSLEMEITD